MSKPLTVFLQLLALFFVLYGFSAEKPEMYLWAVICGVAGAIGIRQRMKADRARGR